AGAVPELDDAGVAARPVSHTGADVGEQLVHDLLRAEHRERLPSRVEIAAPPERDDLLGERLHRLRLRLGRPDPAVLDQRAREVRVERLAMRRVAAELLACAGVTHRRFLLLEAAGAVLAAEMKAVLRERLAHFLDRLLAEVRDRGQLLLGLHHEIADRLDPDPLETVVRADADLELLDREV